MASAAPSSAAVQRLPVMDVGALEQTGGIRRS
jgi:hypothetical protein